MLLKIDRKMLLVKNALEYCLKLMNSGKCTRKIGGILRDQWWKMGTYYPDLESGNEFWNRIPVPDSGLARCD